MIVVDSINFQLPITQLPISGLLRQPLSPIHPHHQQQQQQQQPLGPVLRPRTHGDQFSGRGRRLFQVADAEAVHGHLPVELAPEANEKAVGVDQ